MPGIPSTPALFAAPAGTESASRTSRFAASLFFHIAAVALLPVIVPKAALHRLGLAPRTMPLVAPVEPSPAPNPEPVVRRAPLHAPVTRIDARLFVPPTPASRPALPKPDLREPPPVIRGAEVPAAPAPLAPVLPAAPQPAAPAVQTDVFAGPPVKAPPAFSVPQRAHSAGFDQVAKAVLPSTPGGNPVAASAFDQAAPAASVHNNQAVETGAFGAAVAVRPAAVRRGTGPAGGAGFDQRMEPVKSAALDPTRKAGFDTALPAAVTNAARAAPAPVRITPVEILDKPKPAYTGEARRRKIEGAVLLDVVFTAAGQVRVLGILRPLGYGLDESAVDAARHIRFKPAAQAGIPVDRRATLRIVFEMTE